MKNMLKYTDRRVPEQTEDIRHFPGFFDCFIDSAFDILFNIVTPLSADGADVGGKQDRDGQEGRENRKSYSRREEKSPPLDDTGGAAGNSGFDRDILCAAAQCNRGNL